MLAKFYRSNNTASWRVNAMGNGGGCSEGTQKHLLRFFTLKPRKLTRFLQRRLYAERVGNVCLRSQVMQRWQ
jgi:hypothetical protein